MATRTFSHILSQPGDAPTGQVPLGVGCSRYPLQCPFPCLPAVVSVLLLCQALLRDALGCELGKDIVQVVDVRVAVASEVGAKLCLVVNLIPDDCV